MQSFVQYRSRMKRMMRMVTDFKAPVFGFKNLIDPANPAESCFLTG